MSSRKYPGPPYTARHLRRLAASYKSTTLNKVNQTFGQFLKDSTDNSNEVNDRNEVRNEAQEPLHGNDPTTSNVVKSNDPQHILEESSNVKLIQNEDSINHTLNIENTSTVAGDVFTNFFNELHHNSDETFDEDLDTELPNISEVDEKNDLFFKDIKNWYIKYIHTIPHTAMNSLLEVLRKNTDGNFPKDVRTLLKTPRSTTIYKMGSGDYCHYGVTNAVYTFISMLQLEEINCDCIELIINIDGAPLAKSSEKGAWIISCSENILKQVETIGIYYGEDKPSDPNDLLQRFVNELNELIHNGIKFDEKMYTVKLLALVCDAPAKAYVMNVKYHTGYSSCTKCKIEGKWRNKICFPGEKGILRTDDDFKNYIYINDDEYQKGKTMLSTIPHFGLVTNVPLDYMHLICLGAMLKLIELWINGPLLIRMSESERTQVSTALLNLKQWMPSDFSRNPRKFQNVRRLWKAHELRQFLLYTGPAVLLHNLNSDMYLNFLFLHVAVTILVNHKLCKDDAYLHCAAVSIENFVTSFGILYGNENISHNIHNLLHIVDDVRNFGCLDNFSAFRYENHIRVIKQYIRKGDKPLQQISRRLSEINSAKDDFEKIRREKIVFKNPHTDGPILSPFVNCIQFKIMQHDSLHLNCRNKKNNCILLDNGVFLECSNFIIDDNKMYVIGKSINILSDLYSEPVASSILNIKVGSGLNENLQSFLVQNIVAKVCKIPLKENYALFPIIHTYCNENTLV